MHVIPHFVKIFLIGSEKIRKNIDEIIRKLIVNDQIDLILEYF